MPLSRTRGMTRFVSGSASTERLPTQARRVCGKARGLEPLCTSDGWSADRHLRPRHSGRQLTVQGLAVSREGHYVEFYGKSHGKSPRSPKGFATLADLRLCAVGVWDLTKTRRQRGTGLAEEHRSLDYPSAIDTSGGFNRASSLARRGLRAACRPNRVAQRLQSQGHCQIRDCWQLGAHCSRRHQRSAWPARCSYSPKRRLQFKGWQERGRPFQSRDA